VSWHIIYYLIEKYNLLSEDGDTRDRTIIVADSISGNGLLVYGGEGLEPIKKKR